MKRGAPAQRMRKKIMGDNMKIVGQVSSQEEAKEIEAIARLFVINDRIRILANKSKGDEIHTEQELTIIP
jgi:thiamine monophosphate synthase